MNMGLSEVVLFSFSLFDIQLVLDGLRMRLISAHTLFDPVGLDHMLTWRNGSATDL